MLSRLELVPPPTREPPPEDDEEEIWEATDSAMEAERAVSR